MIYLLYIFEKKAWSLLFVFTYFLLFFQSPSPDLPAIALSLIILNEILKGNQNVKLLFAFRFLFFQYKTYYGVVAYFCFFYIF